MGQGLARYQEDPELTNADEWPWLGVAMDAGADGFSAMQYLVYKLQLNVERFIDPSHGVCRAGANKPI